MKQKEKDIRLYQKNSSSKSIIFLQETHSTNEVENLWRHQWHGDMILLIVYQIAKAPVSPFGTT